MKTSQLLAAGALLAGYAQACTRVRVDMSADQSNPNGKYTTITAWDNDAAPIGHADVKSDLYAKDQAFQIRQGTQVDVSLDFLNGPFSGKIGGAVAFPKASGYTNGKNHLQLEQKSYFEYTTKDQIQHHIYCLWDNYNCGKYDCPTN